MIKIIYMIQSSTPQPDSGYYDNIIINNLLSFKAHCVNFLHAIVFRLMEAWHIHACRKQVINNIIDYYDMIPNGGKPWYGGNLHNGR